MGPILNPLPRIYTWISSNPNETPVEALIPIYAVNIPAALNYTETKVAFIPAETPSSLISALADAVKRSNFTNTGPFPQAHS